MSRQERSASPEAAKTAIDRLTFFSDAVVAIAMTLLAIDLPLPDSTSREQLFSFARHNVPEYLAFVVSFVVIFRFWQGHHRLFRYVTDTTERLVGANGLWLLAIILTPYATRLIFAGDDTSDSDFPYRFCFYALVAALAGLSLFACARVVGAQGLLSEHAPAGLLPRSSAVSLAIAGTFLVSIPLSFVVGPWAFVLWALTGVVTDSALRVQRRRHPEVDVR